MSPYSQDEPAYFLPEPDKEIQRLTDQDSVYSHAMGHKRILAPLDLSRKGLKVLDSATADGLFLRKLETQLVIPYTLVGTDLMSSFFPPPKAWGPYTTYSVHNVADDWPTEFHGAFDLVHQRLVLAGCGKDTSTRDAVSRLAKCVRPGGWIQLGEMDVRKPVYGGPAIHDSWAVMRAVFDTMGADGHDFANQMMSWLVEEGFQHVAQVPVAVSIGRRCSDPGIGQLGLRGLLQSTAALMTACHMLKAEVDQEVTDKLLERLEKEVESQGATYRLLFAYGMKPF